MKSNLLNFGKAVSVLFAAVLLLLSPVAQSATGGSYSSSTGLSTIYTKGIWYPSYFTVLGSPPASGKITSRP